MKENRFFYLYACCIPVKGDKRSLIMDIQRNNFNFIPNVLFEILTKHRTKSINRIKKIYHEEQAIDDFFDFLIKKEYGIFVNSLGNFPKMDIGYQSPSLITNAIIETDRYSQHNYDNIFAQLSNVNCVAVEMRFYDFIVLQDLIKIVNQTYDSTFRTINIFLPYSVEYEQDTMKEFLLQNARVQHLIIYDAPQFIFTTEEQNSSCLEYVPYTMDGRCGNVSPHYFRANREMLCESIKWNNCLNRKVCICKDGNIRNCTSMVQQFGNIETCDLKHVITQKTFTKLWNINKDKISVCHDCEFRYMCHDCRAFIKDSNNIYSKPLNCKYNPYETIWN
ncbi:MAG: grasp-with-spasm system SPASM domain peptide maturase [Prevotellaceae bacterium]|jgi:SPASM domain peptide maturase of grasp-with-spasm system|nr:grasp-with-spasm system SPASM domain peptide maturase [Prevotellaceae bacterium]